MADIALLVVEEFEKRIKNGGDQELLDGGAKKMEDGGGMRVWGSLAAAASGVKMRVALLKEMEPKTGLGLAAIDGFFSA